MTIPQDSAFWSAFIERIDDPACRALSQLLRFDTVSGDDDPKALQLWRSKIAAGFDYLNDLARGLGFVTRRHGDRVLVIEMPGPKDAPVLGFPIHLDVVPAGEGWSRPPFGGEISSGAIWGRGAQDDKGPIIQTLFGLLGAAELSRNANRTFRKTVRLIIVSEEECGVWDDIPFYFERESPPDFSIVPDAHFPITNGEKGFVNLELDIAWAPPLPGHFELTAGERPNVVPAKAALAAELALFKDISGATQIDAFGSGLSDTDRAPLVSQTDGTLGAEFHGVGAHGSTPEKGRNAATDALREASQIPALRRSAAGRALGWLAEAAASLDGAFLGIKRTHEKVGSTTVNLGVLRVDASGLRATLNIRNPIGLSCETVAKIVHESLDHFSEETIGLTRSDLALAPGHREPIYVDPEKFADWIAPMREAYTAVTGREAGLQSIGGTTFAKAFPNAVCFGPVDPAEEPELAHQADEHVTLAAMRRNIEIYGRTIAALAL